MLYARKHNQAVEKQTVKEYSLQNTSVIKVVNMLAQKANEF